MMTAKIIALILILALSVFAQTQTTGRIAGTVKDQQDALIVGANVAVTNQGNGEERTTTTDASGNFAVAFIASASKPTALTILTWKRLRSALLKLPPSMPC